MKIAVFENEFEHLANAFHAVNLIHFNSQLLIDNFVSSQALIDYSKCIEYEYIFVDIDLSSKSHKDGYGVIQDLIKNNYPIEKISVLTGHTGIRQKLKEIGIDSIVVVTKPVSFEEIKKALGK